jgi:50S ribosomal protein L16 3-hydroxylase
VQVEIGFSSDFWADFVGHYWEKRPFILKQAFATPVATSAEVFQGLVTASDQYRAGASLGVRFYIEQGLQQAEIDKHLPESGDGSIGRYAERVNQMLEGRRFGLVVNQYSMHQAQVYLRLRKLFRGLNELVGTPAFLSEAVVFLGNYDKTPFGIHQDSASNFTFVLEGRKRIRAWPDKFFPDSRSACQRLEYERFLDGATTLDGEPGDVLYWPSSYWHVAESLGGLSLTLGMGNYVKLCEGGAFFRHVIRMVENRLWVASGMNACSSRPGRLQQSAAKLPEVIEKATGTLQEIANDPQLEQDLQVEWMNRLTSMGFLGVPPPLAHTPLADADWVGVDPCFPIIWLPADDDEIVCSANGHSFSTAAHPNILKLLERLNRGKACRVKDLIEEHAGSVVVRDVRFEAAPEDIRSLLEKLYSLRAITATLERTDGPESIFKPQATRARGRKNEVRSADFPKQRSRARMATGSGPIGNRRPRK